MRKEIVTALLAVGAVSFGAAVYGHHNRAAFFLENETTRIEGVVTDYLSGRSLLGDQHIFVEDLTIHTMVAQRQRWNPLSALSSDRQESADHV